MEKKSWEWKVNLRSILRGRKRVTAAVWLHFVLFFSKTWDSAAAGLSYSATMKGGGWEDFYTSAFWGRKKDDLQPFALLSLHRANLIMVSSTALPPRLVPELTACPHQNEPAVNHTRSIN